MEILTTGTNSGTTDLPFTGNIFSGTNAAEAMLMPGMPMVIPATPPEPDDDEDTVECPMCGAEVPEGEGECPECGHDMEMESNFSVQSTSVLHSPLEPPLTKEVVWTYAYRKSLPASSFLYVTPEGKRMFPYKDKSGKVDLPHLRNALARIPQSSLPANVKARLTAKAKRIAKKNGVDTGEKESMPIPNELIEELTDSVALDEMIEADGTTYHRASFLVSVANEKNANGRIYPRGIWEREAQMAQGGKVLGQSSHPYGAPDLLDQFIVWKNLRLEGNKVFADALIVPTSRGKDFIELAKAGVNVTASTRGLGSTQEGEVNGVKAQVVQPDFKLTGIDVLYPGTQSVSQAQMLTFEHKENETMPELTLEQLREGYGALVEELTKPLTEQVASLQAENVTQKESLATLTESLTSLTQEKEKAGTQIEELSAQVKTLSEQVQALTEMGIVREHLLELAKGQKASLLILSELFPVVKTQTDLDARFEEVARRNNTLLDNVMLNYRAILRESTPTDLNDPEIDHKKQAVPGPTNQTAAEIEARDKLVARASGL